MPRREPRPTPPRKGVNYAGTRLSKMVIVAPMDGVVSYRDVNVGDLVGEMGAQKPLFRIVDNRILDLPSM